MMHSIAPDNGASVMLQLDEQGRIFRLHNALECITVGQLLLQVKASVPHGEFMGRAKALGLSSASTTRYMACARSFDPDRDAALLAAVKSVGKLLELLCLEPEEIEALPLGGQVRGMTLEDLALMTVQQLRKELQEGNANITQATQEKWDEMVEQIDKPIAEPVHSNVGASQPLPTLERPVTALARLAVSLTADEEELLSHYRRCSLKARFHVAQAAELLAGP